jgi:Flp pilus assembly protein TadD
MLGVFLAVWQRALDAVAGRTLYALLAFGGVALAGVAVGGLLAWWPCRRARHLSVVFASAFFLLACWLIVQLSALAAVTGGWQRLLIDTSRTSESVLFTLAKTAAFFLAAPCVLAGVVLQGARQAYRRNAAEAPRSAAAGIVLGLVALALGFIVAGWLAPVFGAEALTRQMALWFAALASLSILAGRSHPARSRFILACLPLAAVVGLSFMLLPTNGRPVLGDGSFGRLVHRDSGFAQGQPVFEHVTQRHAVSAYEDPDYQFVFAVDGRPLLFGNRFHTARTLTGYVPLLVRPKCAKAAVIGPEAGLYVPFFMRAGVSQVELGGADQPVVQLTVAADAFVTGRDACEQAPLRFGAKLKKGADYDVVFLAPEPLWVRGSGRYFEKALFARCLQALSEHGVVALHLDARALSVGRFAQIFQDFSEIFHGVQVWCTGVNDWVLVGSASEVKTPVDSMLELFEKDAVFRDFMRAGGVALPEALACMLCDGKGLSDWLSGVEKERAWAAAWQAPLLAVAGVRSTLQPVTLEACRQWKAKWILPGEMDVDEYVALLDKVGRTLGARVAVVKALAESVKGKGEGSLESAREAAKINPRDALLIQFAESVELEGRRRIKIGDLKGALKCYENLLSFSAGTARSHYGMGYCLRGNGDKENAYLHFARAVAYAPEQTEYRLDLAQAALSVGEFAEADRQFREILKREPEHVEALYRFAKGLALRERGDKDYAQAVKLAERACVLTQWESREYAFGLADLYMESGRVLEGMGLKRQLKEGVKPVARATP